jgi:hypothetical protein
MTSRKVWTAADLEQMTPADRHALFEASVIWDLDDAPPELVARARARALDHIAQTEHSQQ